MEPHEATHETEDAVADRRRFVRSAALTVLGGAAAGLALGGRPAAAGSGTFIYGGANLAGPDETSLRSTRPDARTLNVANDGAGGYSYGGEADTVYGGHGTVYGVSMTAGNTGGQFVAGACGVRAIAEHTSGSSAVGVTASGAASAGNEGTGVFAYGTTYGGRFTGGRAALRLHGANGLPPGFQYTGEMFVETNAVGGTKSTLWYVVEDGNPGVIRKLAGHDTAGQLHVIDPVRVYDSRLDDANGRSRIASGDARLLSVADGRNLTTGAVSVANVVPGGATAIAYNLAIVDTVEAGFLAVTPGGSASYSAASINWSAAGQILANGQLAKLDASRRVTVFAGGGGATHFVIDVQGYYR